jgi:hypothetical protein
MTGCGLFDAKLLHWVPHCLNGHAIASPGFFSTSFYDVAALSNWNREHFHGKRYILRYICFRYI